MDEQENLFAEEEPAPKTKIKIPTQQQVKALVKETGRSTRQCYYWALQMINKEVKNENSQTP